MTPEKTRPAGLDVDPQAPTQKDDRWPLPVLVALGLVASLLVLVLLGWYFAEQEYRRQCGTDCPSWTFIPPLNSQAMFATVRNTVTAAAALGLGVTIVLSYRRQRVAEETLTYTAETQRLAVKAQTLAEERLEREGLDTLRKRYLDIATLLNTKGNFNHITALHALESLVISWRQFENDREAAACLGLLLSTMRLSRSGTTLYDKEFLETAQRMLDKHMEDDEDSAHSWGELDFDASLCAGKSGISGWVVRGGEKSVSPQQAGPALLSFSNIYGGTLRLSDTNPDAVLAKKPSLIRYLSVYSGSFRFTSRSKEPVVHFEVCRFEGGLISLTSTREETEREVVFAHCTFDGGRFQAATSKPTKIRFEGSRFSAPPMSRTGLQSAKMTFIFNNCFAMDSERKRTEINSIDDLKAYFPDHFKPPVRGSARSPQSGTAKTDS